MDISFTNICIRNIRVLGTIQPRAALGALLPLRTRVATAFFAAPFISAICRSSVTATDRPPRRGLPSPNCHSIAARPCSRRASPRSAAGGGATQPTRASCARRDSQPCWRQGPGASSRRRRCSLRRCRRTRCWERRQWATWRLPTCAK